MASGIALEDEKTVDPNAEKKEQIQSACEQHDIDALRNLASSHGGLIDDHCRTSAWPLLLGCDRDSDDTGTDWRKLERHRDEDQVRLDVDRSFVYYPENESESRRNVRKDELSRAITAVLRRHPMLHYFQGYHDIVQVILLVLGEKASIPAASRLSLLRIRDYMLPTMTATEFHLQLLPAILFAADPELCTHLSSTQPFFALAATLTLYAHDIEEYGDIARLFDYLLASEAIVPLYLFAVVVVSRKQELLEIPSDEPEMLHSILSKLPKPLDLELLIQNTSKLFKTHPPQRLRGYAWSRIPSSSVLKTTHGFEKLQSQTLQDGERFFEQEAIEVRRRELLRERQRRFQAVVRRYRRPATWTGAALLVALAAVYFRGSTFPSLVFGFRSGSATLQQTFRNLWRSVSNL